jgi:enoyl-CoA hydratase/carnithine racemase
MDNPFEPELAITAHGAVRLLKINRPEALNSVNRPLHHALTRVWRHLADDPEARAVVFTGEGRAFSSGGDMDMLKSFHTDAEARRGSLEEAREIVLEMINFPLPLVAAVNGPAVGLGCSLAVLCDIVYIGESAYFADPHVSVGLTAGDGGAPGWPMFVNILKAKEYLFTGDRIPAAEAVAIGLANRVVPDEQLLEVALAFADRLARQPTQSLRSTKRAINMHLSQSVTGPMMYALAAEYHSFDTPEHQEFVNRFLER